MIFRLVCIRCGRSNGLTTLEGGRVTIFETGAWPDAYIAQRVTAEAIIIRVVFGFLMLAYLSKLQVFWKEVLNWRINSWGATGAYPGMRSLESKCQTVGFGPSSQKILFTADGGGSSKWDRRIQSSYAILLRIVAYRGKSKLEGKSGIERDFLFAVRSARTIVQVVSAVERFLRIFGRAGDPGRNAEVRKRSDAEGGDGIRNQPARDRTAGRMKLVQASSPGVGERVGWELRL
jgi:hypothetical protein